jgi:hypothetical protein
MHDALEALQASALRFAVGYPTPAMIAALFGLAAVLALVGRLTRGGRP